MKYDLKVASLRNESFTKEMRRYMLDGVPTIGAFGDEPYEIRFYNRSAEKIMLRLSIDGTDILTGEAATTEPTGRMWVVDPYGKCILKAWPEGDKGGASFLFVSEEGKTVAAHTHGDTSHRGIIAAAVFTEGYKPAYRPPTYYRNHNVMYSANTSGVLRSRAAAPEAGARHSMDLNYEVSSNAAPAGGSAGDSGGEATMDFMPTRSRSVAGTGAGAYVEQKLQTATGLVKPTLDQVLRLRYLWWDEVKAKLDALGENSRIAEFHGFVDPSIPSGFPGNQPFGGIDLGSTPRPAPVFDRFE